MPKAKTFDPQLVLPQSTVTGGFKAAARRTAFGDLSNNTRSSLQQHTMASKGLVKNALPVATAVTKMTIYNETSVEDGKPKDTLLRPAQHLHVTDKAPRAVQSVTVHADNQPQHMVKQTDIKKTTMIYSDEQPQKVQGLNHHYRSQPQVKSTQAAAPDTGRPEYKHAVQQDEHRSADEAIDIPPYDEDAVGASHDEQAANHSLKPSVAVNIHNVPEKEPLLPDGSVQSLRPLSGEVIPDPEDHWDEDDDVDLYEEHGYTTQSYKSYVDNTMSATTLIAPKKTLKVQKELEAAKIFVDAHRAQEDIEEEEWDVSMVAEYGEEIFEYMRELEVSVLRANNHFDDPQYNTCKY